MKKKLALALSLLMVLAMVVSCADKQESSSAGSVKTDIYTEPGTYPIVTEQIELEIFMPQIAQVEDYETNGFTLHWEELTGIDFSFNVAASDAVAEKINILLATNN